jgi:hypothetical protein
MLARSPWGLSLVALLVLLTAVVAASSPAELPSEAAPATPPPPVTVRPGAAHTTSGCILGDINCDGIVDIRDYGLWRQQFGATDCGNPAHRISQC